jgi:hypothetical protein
VQVRARSAGDGNAVISGRQLLPPPAAEDYLVRRRHREAEEESREATTRRPAPSGISRICIPNELTPSEARARLKTPPKIGSIWSNCFTV